MVYVQPSYRSSECARFGRLRFAAHSTRYLQIIGQRCSNCMLTPYFIGYSNVTLDSHTNFQFWHLSGWNGFIVQPSCQSSESVACGRIWRLVACCKPKLTRSVRVCSPSESPHRNHLRTLDLQTYCLAKPTLPSILVNRYTEHDLRMVYIENFL